MVAGLGRGEVRVIAISAAVVVAAGTLHFAAAPPVAIFVVAALALGGIAHLIGESTDQLGNHLSAAATGIIQSAVGNLPELFVCIFALQAGLVAVVQASLVGSILSNALLVLGLAFVAGGWRHGTLRFGGEAPRMIASLLMLAVAALVLPALQDATELVDDDGCERLALDVLGHDQDRRARLGDRLEQRHHVLERGDLAVVDQHQCVLKHRLHLLRVGDEVR